MNVVISSKYTFLKDFVEHLPLLFEIDGEVIYDGRNMVKRFLVEGEDLVVKRFKRPNLIQKIVYSWFRQSKAKRAYDYAFRLRKMEIDTPAPVAYIDQKKGGMYFQGYFVSLCSEDESCAFLWKLSDEEILGGKHDKLLKAIAAELVKIHRQGFMHGDLNLSNILFKKEKEVYRISFIDINRSYFTQKPTAAEKAKNLMRLTHKVCLLERIMMFYNQIAEADEQVEVESIKQALRAFARHKKFVYALKGKRWSTLSTIISGVILFMHG